MADTSTNISRTIIVPPSEATLAETSLRLQNHFPNSPVLERSNARATSGENSTDSGYFSVSATPEKGTPKNSVNGFPRPEEQYSLPPKLLRKPTRLTPFNKEIPKATQERFDDLAILFGEPLYKCVSKGKGKQCPISMKCIVLGESEDNAKPWIVILCDVSVSKRVKKFFDQNWVKGECHSSDPKQPRFEFIIHNRPPRSIARILTDVYGLVTGQPNAHMTSCGSLLQVGSGEDARLATLGGIIKLQSDYGVQLLGLTAAHVFPNKRNDLHVDISWDDEEDDDDLSISEGDTDETSLEQNYELIIDYENDHLKNQKKEFGPSVEHLDAALSAIHTGSDQIWHKVGHLYAKSTESVGSGANFDWALVELDDMRLVKPNLLVNKEIDPNHTIALGLRELMIPSTKMGLGQTVEILSGMHGLRHGYISKSLSYLMLARGTEFIQTYSLVLSDGLGLYPGDSGSWVVDKETREVYGHVVASDVFQEAYVVPQDATFKDIIRQTGAQKAFLPDQTELEALSRIYSEAELRPQQANAATSTEAISTPHPLLAPAQNTSITPPLASETPAAPGQVGSSELVPKSDHSLAPSRAASTALLPLPQKSLISKKLWGTLKKVFDAHSRRKAHHARVNPPEPEVAKPAQYYTMPKISELGGRPPGVPNYFPMEHRPISPVSSTLPSSSPLTLYPKSCVPPTDSGYTSIELTPHGSPFPPPRDNAELL